MFFEALPECLAFRTRHRADVAFIVTMAGRIIQMSHGTAAVLVIFLEHQDVQDIPNGADSRVRRGLCIVSYYIVLYYIILYCIILYYMTLYYIILYYIILYFMT